VRWLALQYRLFEAGSVAGLLAQEGYEVKSLRRGQWEVKNTNGTWVRSFASDNDLWRWTYVLVMDNVHQEQALLSASV
jgi:tmRNA-binding protein